MQLFQRNHWWHLRILQKVTIITILSFLCHNYDLGLCFSYFIQAHHNSWIKYDKFDSSHWRGFIRNRRRAQCTKSIRIPTAFVSGMDFFISKEDHMHSPISHHPTIPTFSTAPETVFTLSFKEDTFKQLGNKSRPKGTLLTMKLFYNLSNNWLQETQSEAQTSAQSMWLYILKIIHAIVPTWQDI